MKERIARLSVLLKSTPRKKLLAFAALIAVTLALPLAVFVSGQQQNLKQNAASNCYIKTYVGSQTDNVDKATAAIDAEKSAMQVCQDDPATGCQLVTIANVGAATCNQNPQAFHTDWLCTAEATGTFCPVVSNSTVPSDRACSMLGQTQCLSSTSQEICLKNASGALVWQTGSCATGDTCSATTGNKCGTASTTTTASTAKPAAAATCSGCILNSNCVPVGTQFCKGSSYNGSSCTSINPGTVGTCQSGGTWSYSSCSGVVCKYSDPNHASCDTTKACSGGTGGGTVTPKPTTAPTPAGTPKPCTLNTASGTQTIPNGGSFCVSHSYTGSNTCNTGANVETCNNGSWTVQSPACSGACQYTDSTHARCVTSCSTTTTPAPTSSAGEPNPPTGLSASPFCSATNQSSLTFNWTQVGTTTSYKISWRLNVQGAAWGTPQYTDPAKACSGGKCTYTFPYLASQSGFSQGADVQYSIASCANSTDKACGTAATGHYTTKVCGTTGGTGGTGGSGNTCSNTDCNNGAGCNGPAKTFPAYTGGTPDGPPNGMSVSQWLSAPSGDLYELSAQFIYLLKNPSAKSQAGSWFQQRFTDNEIGINSFMHMGEVIALPGTPDNVRGEYYPGYKPADVQLVKALLNNPAAMTPTGGQSWVGPGYPGGSAFSSDIVAAINQYASTGWSPVVGATQVINGTTAYINQSGPYSSPLKTASSINYCSGTKPNCSCSNGATSDNSGNTCSNGSCPGDSSGPGGGTGGTGGGGGGNGGCTEGTFQCDSANNLYSCQNGAYAPIQACSSTQTCNQTTGTCDNNGSGGGGNGGGGNGGCTEGTYQCNGQALQICQNGGWNTTKTCSSSQTCDNVNQTCQNNGGGTGNISLSLDLGLDGVGASGDHQNPNGGGNRNPKTPSRPVTVQVYDLNHNLIDTQNGTVSYSSSTGRFTGSVHLKQGFPSGQYKVYVKSPRYLRNTTIAALTIGSSGNPSVAMNLTAGDIVDDNSITILDYNVFLSCSIFSKDGGAACKQNGAYKTNADLNDNGVVDQDDYNLLLREWVVQNGE